MRSLAPPDLDVRKMTYQEPCPKCGMPAMLLCIVPADEPDHDIRTLCCGIHIEELKVKYR